MRLVGGSEAVLDAAKSAHAESDHQFAAELAQLVVRAEPDDEDAKLVKAAALRAIGYQELNPIARSWYLTGALELEGAIDPGRIVGAMMSMVSADQAPKDLVNGWRYWLDTDAAGDTRISVGMKLTDTAEEFTVTLRNSIIVTADGVAPDVDAVVETTSAQLSSDPDAATTVSGDPEAYGRLVGFLDRDIVGFKMHQRETACLSN